MSSAEEDFDACESDLEEAEVLSPAEMLRSFKDINVLARQSASNIHFHFLFVMSSVCV